MKVEEMEQYHKWKEDRQLLDYDMLHDSRTNIPYIDFSAFPFLLILHSSSYPSNSPYSSYTSLLHLHLDTH